MHVLAAALQIDFLVLFHSSSSALQPAVLDSKISVALHGSKSKQTNRNESRKNDQGSERKTV